MTATVPGEIEKAIIEAVENGCFYKEICEHFGVSRKTIYRIRKRYNKPRGKIGRSITLLRAGVSRDTVLAMVEERRLTMRDAAMLCGVCIKTIRNWRQKFGPRRVNRILADYGLGDAAIREVGRIKRTRETEEIKKVLGKQQDKRKTMLTSDDGMWTKMVLSHSHRDAQCASETCGRPASWHLEINGIGSQYCETCKNKIDAKLERIG